ncbi:unnamed protein product [Diamesa serratosioi]
MALVLSNIYSSYRYYFHEYDDPRVENLPLIKSPWPVLTTVALYLYFVIIFGKKWMANRKPFELNNIMNCYNLAQIILNSFIPIVGLKYTYFQKDYNFLCQNIEKDNYSFNSMMVVYVSYFYFLLKILDLLDTIFFVLRKKDNQITFLHIYHHAGIVVACYVHVKFMSASGHPLLLAIINSFVHTIMYGYYFITSFKPELKQSIWWKKHITQVQLIQFAILLVHFTIPIFIKCSYPKFVLFMLVLQNLFMLALFSDFYYKAYIKKKPAQKINN